MFRDLSSDCMVLKHILDSFSPAYYQHAPLGIDAFLDLIWLPLLTPNHTPHTSPSSYPYTSPSPYPHP
ncbi:hypothetical protein EON65_44345 [archaeon]|nr:MAG: hypothetical protein EON65_44345 [archaeon]